MPDELAATKVTLGTVAKWGGSLAAVVAAVIGMWTELNTRMDSHESRIHNIEEHVMWRKE
jgi:hypothetical protein